MPMPAPVKTSLSQCLLLAIRMSPVAVATLYAPMPIHGLLCPYSLLSMVAVINAVAVCPEGNECRFEPSGRSTFVVCFKVFTVASISSAEKASETSSLPHELRLCTPEAFRPSMATAGAYCI